MDFSKLSDEELAEIVKARPAKRAPSEALDFSTMSDEDLQRIANPTSALESAARGIAQGASFGFADEIVGGVEAALTPKSYKQARDESRANNKKAREDNPGSYTTGEVGGAIASSLLPGLGAAGNAARVVKTTAALGGVGGLGSSEAETMGGMLWDTLKGTAIGGATGGAGIGIAKGAKALAPIVGQGLKLTPKANQAQIIEAAERAGVKLTPGMLYDDEVIRGLESSLSQSPSLGGMLVRKKTIPVEKTIDNAAASIVSDATNLSPFEVGQRAKAGIKEAVEKKFAPSRAVYEELSQSTPNMTVDPKSLNRVARNIEGLKSVTLMEGSAGSTTAKRYATWLRNAESVEDVKKIRQALGMDLRKARKEGGSESEALGDLYERISRLEQNSMVRSASETMRAGARSPTGKTGAKMAAEGEEIGKNMVSQLKGANKSYSTEIRNLQDAAKNSGVQRPDSPDAFTRNIDDIDSERIADTLFSPSDYRSMQSTAKQFPEQAELLRQAQLAKIRGKAELADKTLSTPTLLRQTNKLGDEAANVLIGSDKLSKVKDAQTLLESMPEYIGPSGTSKANSFVEMINPAHQVREAGRYGLYRGLSDPRTQKVADYLMKSPKVQALAKENPKAFQAMVLDFSKRAGTNVERIPRAAQAEPLNELDRDSGVPSNYKEQDSTESSPKRGEDKWAADGFENVAKHAQDLGIDRDQLLSNPRAKSLLIAASDLRPGSRAMNDVIEKLKRYGKN